MNELRDQVRRARRRLITEQWLSALSWALVLGLFVAVIALAVPKIYFLGVDVSVWNLSWVASSIFGAMLLASGWTFFKQRSEMDAAIAIDQRFGLKERVASSLSLNQDTLETEAGRALVNDAVRRVERIEVKDQFRIHLHRRAWLTVVPALLAFCLILFVEDQTEENTAEANTAQIDAKQIKTSNKVLRKKLAELFKRAEEQGLKDAGDLFDKLDKGTREIDKMKSVNRQQALVKINDLAKELEERQKKLGGSDKLRKQLNKLKDISPGPAEKLSKALKDGNLKKAMNELQKLQQQIKDGTLDKKAQENLAKQLNQMEKKMREIADAHKQSMDDLKKQMEKAKNSGDNEKANKIQQQLDKLASKAPQMDKLREMAKKMGNCSKCMQEGDAAGAAQGLSELASDLSGMQSEMDQMEMISDLQEQLSQAKDSMGCKDCQGQGCSSCQGDQPGFGMGEGQGMGDRPEEENQVGFRDSRVRQKPKGGRAVVTDEASGPNIKGRVRESAQTELKEFRQRDDDPLTEQRLPKPHQEHAREYFDSLRDGE